jgi:peptide/nickel transport system permease protein
MITRLTGDPMNYILPDSATEAEKAEMRSALGLDKPVIEQYVRYLMNITRGDFGKGFYELRPVTIIYGERISDTLRLIGISYLISIILGLTIGIAAALHRNSVFDRTVMSLSVAGNAIPRFVLGIVLILTFSLLLRLLPSGGIGGFRYYIMPVFCLSTGVSTSIARLTRSSMLDVLQQDYIRTARAKGVPEIIVILKHALRNALIPIVTIIGLQVGTMIGGSVVVETVFAWPGIGTLMVISALQKDFPVVQFGVLIVTCTVVLANVLVDVSYAILDPRIRMT